MPWLNSCPAPGPNFLDVRPEVTGVWSLSSLGWGLDGQCQTPGQGDRRAHWGVHRLAWGSPDSQALGTSNSGVGLCGMKPLTFIENP